MLGARAAARLPGRVRRTRRLRVGANKHCLEVMQLALELPVARQCRSQHGTGPAAADNRDWHLGTSDSNSSSCKLRHWQTNTYNAVTQAPPQ